MPDDGRWQAAMARVDADLLDCLAVNLAVLLADHGAADVRTPFAARWRFELCPDAPAGEVRVDLPPRHLDASLRELTGWETRWQATAELAGAWPAWAAACAGGRAVLVVADAFAMSWLPYAGRQHMEHSFLVTGADASSLTIADAYSNATEWGPARPMTRTLPGGELAGLLSRGGRWSVPALAARPRPADFGELIRVNAAQVNAARGDGRYEQFLRGCDELAAAGTPAAMMALATQAWLLARSRALHARWLDHEAAQYLPAPVRQEFTDGPVTAWQQAAQLGYIGLRRARAGRAVPPSVTGCLRQACDAEARLAGLLRAELGPPAAAMTGAGDRQC